MLARLHAYSLLFRLRFSRAAQGSGWCRDGARSGVGATSCQVVETCNSLSVGRRVGMGWAGVCERWENALQREQVALRTEEVRTPYGVGGNAAARFAKEWRR